MNASDTVINVAASAADREPATVPQDKHPLGALAAAVFSPILGLFRPRPIPTAVEKTTLEHFRSTPVPVTHTGGPKDARKIRERRPKDVSQRRTVAVRAYVRRSPASAGSTLKGGVSHG